MTDVELRLTADLDQATKEVAGFRKEYQDMVRAVEKPLRQVNIARDLERDLDATGKAVRSTKDQLRALQSELINTDRPSERLKTQYRDMTSELQRLERVEARQQTQLSRMRGELTGAGIDTSRLAQEQRRLNAELTAGQAAGRNDAAVAGIRARAAALAQVAREQRAANLEAARQNLGVNRYRELQAQIGRVRAEYQLLRTSGKLTTQELAIAQRSMTERVRETQRALREMNAEQRRSSAIGRLAGGIGGAIGAIGAGYAAVSTISYVSRTADAYNLMNARLRLATASQEEFNRAQTELGRIAQQTDAPVQSLVTLYQRISRPLRDAGRSQEDILRLTEAVSTSFRVSGATAQEAENGVIQFAQALGAGALRGEEFNSVAEQAPRLMQALADGIGVPVGALKEMAAQGQLTAQVVTDALTGQLDTLRKEAETLPDTVGGAMTGLVDRWNAAIGQADLSSLIQAIDDLADTVTDPQVVEGLSQIASAMATLAGLTVKTASEFAKFADNVGFTAAQLSSGSDETSQQVRELEKLKRTLEEVNAARTGSSFFGSSTTALLMKFFAPEQLDAWADELEQKIQDFETRLFGIASGAGQQESQLQEEVDKQRQADISSYATYIADIETLRKSQIKAAEAGAKALVAAEKKATADIQKVRDDRLKIEQRYQEALAGLGGTGEAGYSSAQNLKIGARNALANGDVEGAQRLAQEALKMLQDLAAAGENTYGFTGFIKELQQIELAANDLEQSNAEDKLASIRDEMQQLKDQAAQLKDLPVSVKTDDATVEQVRSTIENLVAQLSQKEVVIPVRVLMPDQAGTVTTEPSTPSPGLATGGILRGPGTGTSDSILARLSNGEGVINARAVQYYGADLIHQLNNLRTPRFATGGVIGNVPVPSIPSLAPTLQQQLAGPVFPDLGRMVLDLGGEEATVYASPQEALNLKRLANKFGPSMRRR